MTARGVYDVEQRKERWRQFLSPQEPPIHVFRISYAPDVVEPPKPWLENRTQRIEWALRTYERDLARLQWLRDDSIPYLWVQTGTEIFAEAFGCDVHRPADTMPFALPMIRSAGEVSAVNVPELSRSSIAGLFEMMDELRRRAGDGADVRLVDIQSPMDIAALIWDKNTFYAALLDEKDAVRELAAKIGELLTAFLDEWFARYGKAFVAHFPDYYMPEGITLSEDEVGSVSKETFVELFLPELVELSNRYGGIGIHCCASARHQWENFRKVPNLRLLNIVQPDDVAQDAYRYFATHTTQLHSWHGDGPPWTWPQQYPGGSRVVMDAEAGSRDEALELSEKLWAACRRD